MPFLSGFAVGIGIGNQSFPFLDPLPTANSSLVTRHWLPFVEQIGESLCVPFALHLNRS